MADPAAREHISRMNKGKKRTEEHKEHYRGPKSPQHVEAMKVAAKDRKRPGPHSEEHRKKQSISLRAMSEERSKDPIYIAKLEARRSAKTVEHLAEKKRLKNIRDYELEKLRFGHFLKAVMDNTLFKCTRCGITQEPEQFTRTNQGPRGLSYICKSCCAAMQLARRQSKNSQGSK